MGTEKPASKSSFWDFNIGHAASLAVFIFGIGVTWANQSANIEAVDQANIARQAAIQSQVNSNKTETGLVMDYMQKRIEKVEGNQLVIDDLRTTVTRLTIQVDNLTSVIRDLQQDLKSQKKSE